MGWYKMKACWNSDDSGFMYRFGALNAPIRPMRYYEPYMVSDPLHDTEHSAYVRL